MVLAALVTATIGRENKRDNTNESTSAAATRTAVMIQSCCNSTRDASDTSTSENTINSVPPSTALLNSAYRDSVVSVCRYSTPPPARSVSSEIFLTICPRIGMPSD